MMETAAMRWWSLCFVSLFAMVSAWSLALPVNGTYDEKEHLVRAYAVATGHLTPVGTATDSLNRPTEAFRVPRSLLPVGTSVDCTWWKPPQPANCQRWTDDRTPVLMPTVAGHYSPVYYAAVGIPLVLRPDRTGILLARLVSALLAALVLASAVWLALRSGRRLLVAAVVLTATPTALNLAGAINPNGLEIAAGILVGTALAALLNGRDDRATLWLAGVGSLLLLTIRSLGPVLLAFLLGTALLLAGRDRIAALARRRDARWILGGSCVAGVAYAGGWLLYSGSAVPMTPYQLTRLTMQETLTQIVTQRIPFCLKQMIAQFSYGETNVSPVVVVGWYLMIGLIVLAALRSAAGRARLAVIGLGVACIGMLAALDLHYLPKYGWFSQGRYAMPAAVGVLLFATVAGRFEDRRGRVTLTVAALTVPLQVYTLAAVMTRFQVGFGAQLNPFGGFWQPAAGPVVPLAALLVGTILLASTAAAATTSRAPHGDTPRTGSRTGDAARSATDLDGSSAVGSR
jgi:hypothetical protein